MSDRQHLEERFHQRCLSLADAVSAVRGAYPGYFSRGLDQDGAVANAEKLVLAQRPSQTFLELALIKRLDLTVEAVIHDPQWRELFGEETRRTARRRLESHGWASD